MDYSRHNQLVGDTGMGKETSLSNGGSSPSADTLTSRELYQQQPRKALWDYWIMDGGLQWDAQSKPDKHKYPKISYARWYAESLRNQLWAWKDVRTGILDMMKYETGGFTPIELLEGGI